MPKCTYTKKITLEVTPSQLVHINQCAALAKKKRNVFLRQLAELAWRDAVRCGAIKEVAHEQSDRQAA